MVPPQTTVLLDPPASGRGAEFEALRLILPTVVLDTVDAYDCWGVGARPRLVVFLAPGREAARLGRAINRLRLVVATGRVAWWAWWAL